MLIVVYKSGGIAGIKLSTSVKSSQIKLLWTEFLISSKFLDIKPGNELINSVPASMIILDDFYYTIESGNRKISTSGVYNTGKFKLIPNVVNEILKLNNLYY